MWLLLVACGARLDFTTHGDGVSLARLRTEGLVVAPTQVALDLPAPELPTPPNAGSIEIGIAAESGPPPTALDPVRDAPFLRNEFIGNIRFGGGLIRTGDIALDVRARLIEFNHQGDYLAQARTWLDTTVQEALTTRGLDRPAQPIGGLVPASRELQRGMHPEDGRDNINAPRGLLVPASLPAAAVPPGARWLLVPFLRHYYTHNGGWFIGQRYGCSGGARVEVVLALYDTTTGQPAWWIHAVGQQLGRAQPSTTELDQYLLWAEDEVELALRRSLFR